MGSVSPLIAIWQELKKKDSSWEAVFVGSEDGPEKEYVTRLGIPYYAIKTGRFRRYFSLTNIVDFFRLIKGQHQAKKILSEFKPDLVLTSGSFVCYPVAKMAHKLKIPFFIHQQDIRKGLANKLMEKWASAVTITFDSSLSDFDYNKTYFTSNPARPDMIDCDASKAISLFNLDPNRLTIVVTGGGTGAQAINQLTLEALGELTKDYQVVHLTGEGKGIEHLLEDYYDRATYLQIKKYYHPVAFVHEGMCELLKHATLVVSRAGLSSLTELSLLQKPVILIPIPDSHQEDNAKYFVKYNAVKALDQKEITGQVFAKEILSLMENESERVNLSKNISSMIDPFASKRYVDLIYKFLQL